MIVTKTPLRISFFGGGSDIPEFYREHGGVVVSAAINSYIYIAAHQCVATHLKVIYSQLELEHDIEKIKHDRVRETLKHFDMTTNMEIASFSDIPTKGTGLGSSSTFTVGLIHALAAMNNQHVYPAMLAETASMIEIEKCKEPIGKQDQYAASYGGLRVYEFNKNDDVTWSEFKHERVIAESLERNLLCFNTGIVRPAASVLAEQVKNLKANVNVDNTKRIVENAWEAIHLLKGEQYDAFGELLDKSWQIKKKLSSNVSNGYIDEMYSKAMEAGALGGKILGAGGGGYLLMYVPQERQAKVLEAMKGYLQFKFKFDYRGSRIEMRS